MYIDLAVTTVIKPRDSSLYFLSTNILVLLEFYLYTYCKRSFDKKSPRHGYILSNCSQYVLLLHRFIPIRIQKRSDRVTPHDSLNMEVISQFLWQVNKDIWNIPLNPRNTAFMPHIWQKPYYYDFKNNIFSESIVYSGDGIPMHFLVNFFFSLVPITNILHFFVNLPRNGLMVYEIGIMGGT